MAAADAYKVVVVVDENYGERLAGVSSDVPVWIVDTPGNRPVVERIWRERRAESHLTGVTLFNSYGSTPEQRFLAEIDTIDLHHGEYSADPPYSILEVIGVRLTPAIKTELAEYGFDQFGESQDGFIANRLIRRT